MPTLEGSTLESCGCGNCHRHHVGSSHFQYVANVEQIIHRVNFVAFDRLIYNRPVCHSVRALLRLPFVDRALCHRPLCHRPLCHRPLCHRTLCHRPLCHRPLCHFKGRLNIVKGMTMHIDYEVLDTCKSRARDA
jgi:hypothetical protein